MKIFFLFLKKEDMGDSGKCNEWDEKSVWKNGEFC